MNSKTQNRTDDTDCRICPRMCGADRKHGQRGYCGADDRIEVSKIMLHHWEEPPISGSDPKGLRGSGAVFFAHCSLGCVYCQNRKISRREAVGQYFTEAQLAGEFLKLEESGAYNINLVSPTHYAPMLAEAVRLARKNGLGLPIVWNTGGYENVNTIRSLADTVDIFLTDFKYSSPELANRYSAAADYPEAARKALAEMFVVTGRCVFGEDGMMKRGVIIRHLVLPSHRDDSVAVLRTVADTVPVNDVKLSLMAQYTPEFLPQPSDECDGLRELRRKITTYEYEKVCDEAVRLGFDGYMQERSSATSRFTPDF